MLQIEQARLTAQADEESLKLMSNELTKLLSKGKLTELPSLVDNGEEGQNSLSSIISGNSINLELKAMADLKLAERKYKEIKSLKVSGSTEEGSVAEAIMAYDRYVSAKSDFEARANCPSNDPNLRKGKN